MKWNFEPTEKTDQECPYCGLFYSDRGIKAHKSNCPLKGEDYWVRRPESAETDEGRDLPEDGGVPDEDEPGDDVGTDPSSDTTASDEDATTSATTNGGRRAPPQPTIDVDDQDDGDDVDDLPDRFVPVEDYVDEVRRRDEGDVDVDALEENLADYDVVDVKETTEDHLAAYTLDEVTA